MSIANAGSAAATADPVAEPPADPMPTEIAALRDSRAPVWIFAYGSLIWDPELAEWPAEPARLWGYHRAFCLYSYDYRGTRAQPGLTLGLDRGGSCRGVAFRLGESGLAAALDRLWMREMTAPRVYDLRQVAVHTAGGSQTAYAFVVRRNHADYAAALPPAEAARLIARAIGRRGRCRDYLDSTLAHLAAHGIRDRTLDRLAKLVAAFTPAADGSS